MDKRLHIICLNVPYPVDYGGVFDLFYKLGALQQQGVKIYLHCFEYGRGEQPELNKYCEKVFYYTRVTGLKALFGKYPYIVSSRRNEDLLHRLLEDNFPILMEGVHCTYLLNDERFKHRKCFVRLHNVEHLYYHHLFKNSTLPLQKIHFFREAKLLKRYEKRICKKANFWTVIEKDAETYREMGCESVSFLPLFLPSWTVGKSEGMGSFCLYHGDLSVGENEKAARWLVTRVFKDLQIPFVIAGKNPPARLTRLLHNSSSICLVANPDDKEMQDLIAKAHVHLIPSFNTTGIKLKLINALFNGRHCVVNRQTVDGSGLEKACHIAEDANEFAEVIAQLYGQPLGDEDVKLRQERLPEMFNNERNARLMVSWIWGDKM
ncbi:MAG TPA: glycosyltransferase family 4 protein [Segetibacter sp.]